MRGLLGLAGVLLLLLLPAAAAAPARVGLEMPLVEPIPPGAERTIQGNLTYAYDASSGNRTNVTLALAAGPAWLRAGLEPAALQVNASNLTGRTVVPVRLTLAVLPGAQADEQHTVRVRVDAEANPPLEATTNTADVVVRVAYVGKLKVSLANATVRTAPEVPGQLTLTLTNEGNGPARVVLEVASADKALTVLPPPPVILLTGSEDRTRTINVSVLARQAGSYPVVLRYASVHPLLTSVAGDAGTVTFTVEARSQGVPGPGVLAALAAGALAAAAVRGAGSRRP